MPVTPPEAAAVQPAAPPGRQRVLRFTPLERIVHWTYVALFALLLLTGTLFFFPSVAAIAVGGSRVLRIAHLALAALMLTLPIYQFSRDRGRTLRTNLHELFGWSHDDTLWLLKGPLKIVWWPLSLPAQGKFNAGQKLNFYFTAVAYLTLVASGVGLMLRTNIGQAAFTLADIVHTNVAYISVPVILGHIFLAAINPRTRGALRGMLSGQVDAGWLAHHHPRWRRPGAG